MLPWFTKYPNQNDEILNLDWVIRQVENLKAAYEAFLAANSLTFADPITWDITKQYSKNTIVLSPEGDAYLSKKAVGAGIQLNNTDYWLEIFNFAEYVRTANSNLTIHIEQNTTRATAAYAVDDWLLWEDVLYKVTAAIAEDDLLTIGTNIVHFTVEDFCRAWQTYMVNTIAQYKNDIDASELTYKQQLDQTVLQYKNDIDASELQYKNDIDASEAAYIGVINALTASMQAQLDAAIAGATVDSEVINARIGYDSHTYSTLGEAIRLQLNRAFNSIEMNYNNVLFDTSRQTITSNNVTFTYNADGTYTVSGTSTGTSYCNITDDLMPFDVVPGETYFVVFDSAWNSAITLECWQSDPTVTRLFSSSATSYFKVPAGCNKLYFRIATWNASGLNETIKLPVVSTLKNSDGWIVFNPTSFTVANVNAALALAPVLLDAGTYTVDGQITMPENGTLKGSGAATILDYTGTVNCIVCADGGEFISDLTIKGQLTAKPDSYTGAIRRAILVWTSDTYGMSPTTIDNVYVIGFSKDGILVDNKGYVALNSVIISNCYFRFNGSGISLIAKGEYAVITNCVSIDNYYGIIDSGGNNKICNCGFDRNTIGLLAIQATNDTHSDVISCSFNHNTGQGAQVYRTNSPITFTACQFYGNVVHIANIEGKALSMVNCIFGSGTVSFKKGGAGGLNMLANCIFEAAPSVSTEDSPVLVFDNCYQVDGTPVTAP